MDWDGIKFFLALAEARTLADAAATLGVSDATVMRRIQGLESALGTTLFSRRPNGHELTARGALLLPLALTMRDLAARIHHDYANDDEELTGTVLVTTTEYGADFVIGPLLAEFGHRHPALCLTLDISPGYVDLTQPEPSVALRFERPQHGPYLIKKLGQVAWGFFVSTDLATKLKLNSGDVLTGAEPYVGWAPPVHDIRVARVMQRVFAKAQARVRVPTLRGQWDAARAGLGVAHLPVRLGDADDHLLRVRHADGDITLDAWLVQPTQFRHLARVKAVAAFIEHAFARSARASNRINIDC